DRLGIGKLLLGAGTGLDVRRIGPFLLVIEAERVAELVNGGPHAVIRIETHAVPQSGVMRANDGLTGWQRRTAWVLGQIADDDTQAGRFLGTGGRLAHRIVAVPALEVDPDVARPFLDGAAPRVAPGGALRRRGPRCLVGVLPADLDVGPAGAGGGPQ